MHVNTLAREYAIASIRNSQNEMKHIQSLLNGANDKVSTTLEGDASDFHNASVDLTNVKEFSLAYRLLEIGISKFPSDTDLLGDLLLYGMKCRSYSDLERYYKQLLQFPKDTWTWRAFHFSIEYLMAVYAQATGDNKAKLEKEILALLDDYKENSKYFSDQSDREKAYNLKHRFYMSKRDIDNALKPLQEAMEEIPGKCPQCALRLADYYFDAGQYEKVLMPAVCAALVVEAQPAINYSYLYFILGASREYILRQEGKVFSEDNIRPIYRSYYAALVYAEDDDRKRQKNIKNRIKVLEYDSGISSNIDFSRFDD